MKTQFSIGDERVYPRIARFEKGLIRFTGTTNVFRLFAKHRPDIRRKALWKNGSSGTARIGKRAKAI